MSDGVPREDVDDDKLFKADAWELVHDGVTSVRRLLVPGGWLYQVSFYEDIIRSGLGEHTEALNLERAGWHPPVFVPVPR